MKVTKQEKKWEPITLVIESEAEYYWLLACLNTSLSTAKDQASDLNFEITQEMSGLAMLMFTQVENAYRKELNN